jgi:hypothetical protein
MSDTTSYESARSCDSDDSTVETVLSTVENKEEEEKEKHLFACSHCGTKYKFLPTLKVPEDIFPPQTCRFSNRSRKFRSQKFRSQKIAPQQQPKQ